MRARVWGRVRARVRARFRARVWARVWASCSYRAQIRVRVSVEKGSVGVVRVTFGVAKRGLIVRGPIKGGGYFVRIYTPFSILGVSR